MQDWLFKFSRKNRLVTKHDFQSVFENPFKIKHKYLITLYRPNQLSYSRLGVIASKQRLKLALHRNLFKRLVRESFRHHQEQLKGLDIIVLLRSECTPIGKELNKKALRDDIDRLWQQFNKPSKAV